MPLLPPLPYGRLNNVENVYGPTCLFFISYAVHMHSPDSLIHATQLLIITNNIPLYLLFFLGQ